MNTVFPLSILQQHQQHQQYHYQQQQQQLIDPSVLQYHYHHQQQSYLSYPFDHNSAAFPLSMLQQHQQFQNEIKKEELFIQQCEQKLLLLAEYKLQQQQQQEQQNHQDQDHVSDNNTDVDTNNDTNDNTNDDTNDNTNNSTEVRRGHRKRRQKQQVRRRRSKRIRHKNHGDYAMTMDVVTARLIELGIVTPEEADSHDFIIRLAEKNDLSATTKEELQQQVLHLCRYGLLARWVLQDDGSRILEIVRCSGIEGHHKDTRIEVIKYQTRI